MAMGIVLMNLDYEGYEGFDGLNRVVGHSISGCMVLVQLLWANPRQLALDPEHIRVLTENAATGSEDDDDPYEIILDTSASGFSSKRNK